MNILSLGVDSHLLSRLLLLFALVFTLQLRDTKRFTHTMVAPVVAMTAATQRRSRSFAIQAFTIFHCHRFSTNMLIGMMLALVVMMMVMPVAVLIIAIFIAVVVLAMMVMRVIMMMVVMALIFGTQLLLMI